VEQYLVVLFILFSIVSALLERRKRAKQLAEQAQQRALREQNMERQEASSSVPPPSAQEAVEEEEMGWPFSSDAFQQELPQSRPLSQVEVVELEALEAERRALEAERHALHVERAALAASQGAARSPSGADRRADRQRVSDLVRQHAEQERARKRQTGEARRVGKWHLCPETARDAIVYSEILGRPRAERMHDLGAGR
jgi:hypothetical protein